MMQKISVIVPVYNTEQYLKQCIDSILAQTYENLEIVLIDDGSTDKSADICDKYAKIDKRIIVIHQQNKGQTIARLAGVTAASGLYAACVDSDDCIAENYIEALVKASDCGEADIVSCQLSTFVNEVNSDMTRTADSGAGKWSPEGSFSGEEFKKVFMEMLIDYTSSNVSGICKLVKRDIFLRALEKVDASLRIGEDLAALLLCISASKSFSFIKDTLYYYRINQNSTLHTKWKTHVYDLVKMKECLQKTMDFNEYELESAFQKKFAIEVYDYIAKLTENFENFSEYRLLAAQEITTFLSYFKDAKFTNKKNAAKFFLIRYKILLPIWLRRKRLQKKKDA